MNRRITKTALIALTFCCAMTAQGQTPTPNPSATASSTPSGTPCPLAGAWSAQSPYPIAVSGQAVASQGGNVYSFGGIANNVAITSAYKYTPSTSTWTPIASLPAPRGWFSATTDGTSIYLLGGVDENFNTTATLWRYNPGTNTYTTSLASYTIPTYFHASAYLSGKIYRIAGRGIGTDFHVEVYTIATNSWSMAANYPFANHSLMAAALGSYVYAGGGNASPDKTWRYDPVTNTWDDAAVADFPAGRSASASGAYNGRWLVAGGDVNFGVSTSAIAWDPVTNTWSDLPNMVQARDYLGGATAGQSFYAVAGNSGPGTSSNDNQRYTETCATPSPTPTSTPSTTPNPTPTPTPVIISGTIHYCTNPTPGPVPDVVLTLTGSSSGSTMSDASGNYSFTVAAGGSYTITPSKAARLPHSNGIDTVDVVRIQRHFIMVGPPLVTGCPLDAGDCSPPVGITTGDVIAAQRFFLGLTNGIGNVGRYKFNPLTRSYTNVVSDQAGQDYDVLVFGDVISPFVE